MRVGTVIAVRRDGKTAVAADGLAAIDALTLKNKAKRLERVAGGQAVLGCALPTALVGFLSREVEHWMDTGSDLAAVAAAVATDWTEEKRFAASVEQAIIATNTGLSVISSAGESYEPEDGMAAIGPGAEIAIGAAHALVGHTPMRAEEVAREALRIAAMASHLVNDQISVEVI